jgi:hypothetical protein
MTVIEPATVGEPCIRSATALDAAAVTQLSRMPIDITFPAWGGLPRRCSTTTQRESRKTAHGLSRLAIALVVMAYFKKGPFNGQQ